MGLQKCNGKVLLLNVGSCFFKDKKLSQSPGVKESHRDGREKKRQ